MEKDTYKTIIQPSAEVLFKDRNSKFYGYAFPVTNTEMVKGHIIDLKKKHHSARHWCYAYQIGINSITYRANDDGEPNNSAGMPIYGQIQSFDVTNILIVVVRYFGGTKLGVSGLINAYRTAAKMAMENANIETKNITRQLIVSCKYDKLNKVMRIIKERNLKIIEQDMQLDCLLRIEVGIKESENVFDLFKQLQEVSVKYD
jgi:uncharacterized YigZ family protein